MNVVALHEDRHFWAIHCSQKRIFVIAVTALLLLARHNAGIVDGARCAVATQEKRHEQDSQWNDWSPRLRSGNTPDRSVRRVTAYPGAALRLHGRCNETVQLSSLQRGPRCLMSIVKEIPAQPQVPSDCR
jgi:hypothetical protein